MHSSLYLFKTDKFNVKIRKGGFMEIDRVFLQIRGIYFIRRECADNESRQFREQGQEMIAIGM